MEHMGYVKQILFSHQVFVHILELPLGAVFAHGWTESESESESNMAMENPRFIDEFPEKTLHSHRIHIWYICHNLGYIDGKC